MDDQVKIKAKFSGTSRRFEISSSDITWDDLVAKLCSLFDIGPDFCLKYCDDENELVLISSQEELDEALRVKKKPGLLSLFIEDAQTNDTTLLNLENRNQNSKQEKQKGTASCYVALASSIAPEFAEMNARLEQSRYTENTNEDEPPASVNEEQESQESKATASESMQEDNAATYTNLAEVMALSKQQPKSDPFPNFQGISSSNQMGFISGFEQQASRSQNANAASQNGASRGWFDHFEDQRQQSSNRSKGKAKKSKKKKQSCYNELASNVAPHLASLKVREPKKTSAGGSASESDDADVSDTSMNVQVDSVSVSNPPPEMTGATCNKPSDFNQQQMNQNGQYREIKRPKRSKKHGKKKSCYAQAALEISPLFAAMNERLKEKQWQQRNSPEPLNDEPEDEESESFIFVNAPESLSSESPSSVGTEAMEVIEKSNDSLPDDFMPDGCQAGNTTKQEVADSEADASGNEMTSTTVEEQKSLDKVVKEVLNSSMDFIVDKTVERMHQLNLNQSRTPSGIPNEINPFADAEETSQVIHKGITCDVCEQEIHGIRYKCCNCRDFDLCEMCEAKSGIHDVEHVFLKLKLPAPGCGRKHGEMVPIFKNSVYKKTLEKKQRKAVKEAEKQERKALKQVLKTQEKERRKEEKYIMKKQRQEVKSEIRNTNPRAIKMAKVYQKLKMEFVCDASYPDGIVVSPGQQFLKTWVIRNAGSIAWNQWIKLECIEGDIMAMGKSQVDVPHLKPNMQGEVSVEFIAPEIPGTYSSKWHLTYGLHTFGPQLWCEIQVAGSSDAGQEKRVQCDQSTQVYSNIVHNTSPVPIIEDTKVQAAAYLIVDDNSGSEYHSSEETPENEQGGVIVTRSEEPLISLGTQRQELEWDAGCVHDVEVAELSADNNGSQNLISFSGAEDVARSNYSEDSDDGDDSDSSEDEITVLIPPCFDPDIPLSAEPVPVKVGWPKRRGIFNPQFLPRSFEPYLNLDDNDGLSSLPDMVLANQGSSIETLDSKSTDEPIKDPNTPVHVTDVATNTNQGENTPSGRISPTEAAPHMPEESPVEKQPSTTPEQNDPEVSQDLTINSRPTNTRTSNEAAILPTNVVSEVLSSAFDAVTTAGKAAIATVDNLIKGNVEASAVYKPEDDCEVTVDRRRETAVDRRRVTAGSDAPLPRVIDQAPGNDPMSRLIEMGFGDRRVNERLLRKHNNDINATIDELLNHTQNDWHSQRH